MSGIKNLIKNVKPTGLTNNTQRVARKLLTANGSWVSRTDLEKVAASAAARVRDLRKVQFGEFVVECASAVNLNKRGSHHDYFYRINPRTVTTKQVKTVFRQI